jgi:hypothetical protein
MSDHEFEPRNKPFYTDFSPDTYLVVSQGSVILTPLPIAYVHGTKSPTNVAVNGCLDRNPSLENVVYLCLIVFILFYFLTPVITNSLSFNEETHFCIQEQVYYRR